MERALPERAINHREPSPPVVLLCLFISFALVWPMARQLGQDRLDRVCYLMFDTVASGSDWEGEEMGEEQEEPHSATDSLILVKKKITVRPMPRIVAGDRPFEVEEPATLVQSHWFAYLRKGLEHTALPSHGIYYIPHFSGLPPPHAQASYIA